MVKGFFHWSVLIFFALWFAVIVPGHQRGVVQLPGSTEKAEPAEHCSLCPVPPEDDGAPLPEAPGRNCAVCQLLATLTTAPAITFDVQELEPLGELPTPAYLSIVDHVDALAALRGRAPPHLVF